MDGPLAAGVPSAPRRSRDLSDGFFVPWAYVLFREGQSGTFLDCYYGFWPGRDAHNALLALNAALCHGEGSRIAEPVPWEARTTPIR